MKLCFVKLNDKPLHCNCNNHISCLMPGCFSCLSCDDSVCLNLICNALDYLYNNQSQQKFKQSASLVKAHIVPYRTKITKSYPLDEVNYMDHLVSVCSQTLFSVKPFKIRD